MRLLIVVYSRVVPSTTHFPSSSPNSHPYFLYIIGHSGKYSFRRLILCIRIFSHIITLAIKVAIAMFRRREEEDYYDDEEMEEVNGE